MARWSLSDRQRDVWRYRVGRGVDAAYRATRQALRDRVVRSRGRYDSLWDDRLWVAAADRSIVPVLRSLYVGVATDAADALGLLGPMGQTFVMDRAVDLLDARLPVLHGVGATIGERVNEVAAVATVDGHAPGWVLQRLGLEDEFAVFAAGPMSVGLMERVTRTESTAGLAGASVVALDALGEDDLTGVDEPEVLEGLVGTKTWRCQFINSRDTHIEAHGQIRVAGLPFDVGGWLGMFPGDPELPPRETINCLCTLELSVVPVSEGNEPGAGVPLDDLADDLVDDL